MIARFNSILHTICNIMLLAVLAGSFLEAIPVKDIDNIGSNEMYRLVPNEKSMSSFLRLKRFIDLAMGGEEILIGTKSKPATLIKSTPSTTIPTTTPTTTSTTTPTASTTMPTASTTMPTASTTTPITSSTTTSTATPTMPATTSKTNSITPNLQTATVEPELKRPQLLSNETSEYIDAACCVEQPNVTELSPTTSEELLQSQASATVGTIPVTGTADGRLVTAIVSNDYSLNNSSSSSISSFKSMYETNSTTTPTKVSMTAKFVTTANSTTNTTLESTTLQNRTELAANVASNTTTTATGTPLRKPLWQIILSIALFYC